MFVLILCKNERENVNYKAQPLLFLSLKGRKYYAYLLLLAAQQAGHR